MFITKRQKNRNKIFAIAYALHLIRDISCQDSIEYYQFKTIKNCISRIQNFDRFNKIYTDEEINLVEKYANITLHKFKEQVEEFKEYDKKQIKKSMQNIIDLFSIATDNIPRKYRF